MKGSGMGTSEERANRDESNGRKAGGKGRSGVRSLRPKRRPTRQERLLPIALLRRLSTSSHDGAHKVGRRWGWRGGDLLIKRKGGGRSATRSSSRLVSVLFPLLFFQYRKVKLTYTPVGTSCISLSLSPCSSSASASAQRETTTRRACSRGWTTLTFAGG